MQSKIKKRNIFTRRTDFREQKQSFLIVCEGEKTEPTYFKSFRVNIKVEIYGLGHNTISLVKEAIEIKNKDQYDQVWVVFDKDEYNKDFSNAIQLAKSNNIQVAYSNESFELWYLLHFCFQNTPIGRSAIIKKLDNYLPHKYEKNSVEIYNILQPLQQQAIKNAKTLLKQHGKTDATHCNPSTTVHNLVQELNKHLI